MADGLQATKNLARGKDPNFTTTTKSEDVSYIAIRIAAAVLAKGDSRAALSRAISEIKQDHRDLYPKSEFPVADQDLRAFAASIDKDGLRKALEAAREKAADTIAKIPYKGEVDFLEKVSRPAQALCWIQGLDPDADSPSSLELLLRNNASRRYLYSEFDNGGEILSREALRGLALLCDDMREMRRVLLEQRRNGGQSARGIDDLIRARNSSVQPRGVLATLAALAHPDWERNSMAVQAGQILCHNVIKGADLLHPKDKDLYTERRNPDRAIRMVLSHIDGLFTNGVVSQFMGHKKAHVQFPSTGAIVYSHGFDELGCVDRQATVYDYYPNGKHSEEARNIPIDLSDQQSVVDHCTRMLKNLGQKSPRILGVQIIASAYPLPVGLPVLTYKIALR